MYINTYIYVYIYIYHYISYIYLIYDNDVMSQDPTHILCITPLPHGLGTVPMLGE